MKAANIWSPIKGNCFFAAFFSFFILATGYLLFATINPVYAQECISTGTTPQEIIDNVNKCAIEKNVFDDKLFTLNSIAGIIDGLNTHLIGQSDLHPETNNITAGRGALAAGTRMIASLYAAPPASGVIYFAQEFQKFNPVQPAYAATGEGYTALGPVQELWKVFRNASYVGFIIIFVIIGFMIMFRAHISPQAVATVQDSLPRIVVALILVTFSYAIAGLMIDLMFLIINLFLNLLDSAGVIRFQEASTLIFDKSIIGVVTGSLWDIVFRSAEALKTLLGDIFDLGSLNFLHWGVGGIAGLIVGAAALFIIFRVFIMLLMAYVTIILLTLAAPFFFLIQALPGNNGASTWFKQMISNIAVFPAVSIMIILAAVVADITNVNVGGPALDSTETVLKFPLLVGGIDSGAISKIIGLGFLFITPSVAQMIKDAIGVKGGPNLGAAASALGAGAGLASFPARFAVNRYQEAQRNRRLGEAIHGRQTGPRENQPGGEPAVGGGR